MMKVSKPTSLALASATPVATPEQTVQLTALTNLDSQLQSWRTSLQALLNNPDAFVGDQRAWESFSTDRQNTITKIENQAALDTQSSARGAETTSLFRVGGVTGAVLLTMLVVTALLATIARTVTVFHQGAVLIEGNVADILTNDQVRDVYLGKQAA